MSTETTSNVNHTFPLNVQASGCTSGEENRAKKKADLLTGSLALNTASTSTSVPTDEWTSLKAVNRYGDPSATFTRDLQTSVQFTSNLDSSLTSLVTAFMVTMLQLFSKLQKADMENSLNQMSLVISNIKNQITKLTEEKDANFTKDMVMATFETASALVQLAGSAVTTVKLSGKATEQSSNFNSQKLLAQKGSSATALADTNSKTNVADGLVRNAGGIPESVETAVQDVKTARNNAAAGHDAAERNGPPLETETELTNRAKSIEAQIRFIETKGQLFTSAGALLKAGSPWAQGIAGKKATEAQIEAKQAENAKEVANMLYRMFMDYLSQHRDAFSRMISMLQEVQKQNAENSLASSRKMA